MEHIITTLCVIISRTVSALETIIRQLADAPTTLATGATNHFQIRSKAPTYLLQPDYLTFHRVNQRSKTQSYLTNKYLSEWAKIDASQKNPLTYWQTFCKIVSISNVNVATMQDYNQRGVS